MRVVAFLALAACLASCGQERSGEVSRTPGAEAASGASTVVTLLEIERSVPLRIFSIYTFDRNNGEVAIIDLEAGTSTVYPAGTSAISGLVTGAVMTPLRDLAVWTLESATYVFSDDLAAAELTLDPNVDPTAGIAASLRVVPTPNGDALWVVQPGAAYGDVDMPTVVELIELPTGRVLGSFDLEPNVFPVGATKAGLVLNTERLFDTGDGWMTEPGSEQVIAVDTSGARSEIGPGRALAASADTIVRRVCSPDDLNDCALFIGDVTQDVARPGEGTWAPVGGPGIPSDGMPLQPISPDGTSMLVAFGQDLDVNGTPARSTLFVVDIGDGSTREIATFDGRYPLATWSADGKWIAVIGSTDITLYETDDPTTTVTVGGAIPKNHYPFAAG